MVGVAFTIGPLNSPGDCGDRFVFCFCCCTSLCLPSERSRRFFSVRWALHTGHPAPPPCTLNRWRLHGSLPSRKGGSHALVPGRLSPPRCEKGGAGFCRFDRRSSEGSERVCGQWLNTLAGTTVPLPSNVESHSDVMTAFHPLAQLEFVCGLCPPSSAGDDDRVKKNH